MLIGVLGSTTAADAHGPVTVGGPKQRALLAALALHAGRAVPVDRLADLVWDGAPPPGGASTLQTYVAGLRRVLEPDRSARGAAVLLVTEQPGYALRPGPDDEIDAVVVEASLTAVHAQVAPWADRLLHERPEAPPVRAATVVELQRRLGDAEARWRSTPYADLGDAPEVAAERGRLLELRLLALEDRATLALLLGRPAAAAAELEALTRRHPLRERLWALRALALAGSGRQGEATAVLGEVRALLDVELGLEPGPELRAVQTAVLRQAPLPALAAAAAAAGPAAATTWPLVGRGTEAAVLGGLVDQVVAGTASGPLLAALTGEPGIGKSRLCAEVAALAGVAGVPVVVGRCSQDEGAPPLWPWAQVLTALGAELPTATGAADGAADFRAWQGVVSLVAAAAAGRGLVVVLDDLHWADDSTLRVLRMLVETTAPGGGRLLVVGTWREHPVPSAAPSAALSPGLADVAETFARAHAVRLRLGGVSASDAARLVQAVTRTAPAPADAEELCRRTEGNPFFLVELARLARDDGDLARLLAERRTPAAVHDVLTRRLDRLRPATADLLRQAAVLGRTLEVDVLAAVAGLSEETVLEELEPALGAGLLAEEDVDRFRFTHSLVRDTALAGLPLSRRARIHARAAETLAGRHDRPDLVADVARHWASAGPRHRREAWQSAAAAARAAAAVHAHAEARTLLTDALAAQAEDAQSSPVERFGLLLDLAGVLDRAGRRREQREVAHAAYAVAAEVGDPLLEAAAVTLTSAGALWQGARRVDEAMVAHLRATLERLPHHDSAERCRVMLALATETYYGTTPQERVALAEQALAMAARLADPELRLSAALQAVVAMWRPVNAARRLELAEEAVRLADDLHDDLARVSARTLLATAAAELGRIEVLDAELGLAREEAESGRHLHALVALDSLEGPWLAMRGETERLDALVAHLGALDGQVTISGIEDAVPALQMSRLLWQHGHDAEVLALAVLVDEQSLLPTATFRTAMLCRTGDVAAARDYARLHPDRIARTMTDDTWYSPLGWSAGAETAAHLGDAGLGATAYSLLRPLSGGSACAGSGISIGPVDLYLALAAVATGERAVAARHAEAAAEQCARWRVPLAAQWVRRERERWGL